jgi:hypothetical protein
MTMTKRLTLRDPFYADIQRLCWTASLACAAGDRRWVACVATAAFALSELCRHEIQAAYTLGGRVRPSWRQWERSVC